ncbi:MAG: class D sortase [Patescibacteria group bacterium]
MSIFKKIKIKRKTFTLLLTLLVMVGSLSTLVYSVFNYYQTVSNVTNEIEKVEEILKQPEQQIAQAPTIQVQQPTNLTPEPVKKTESPIPVNYMGIVNIPKFKEKQAVRYGVTEEDFRYTMGHYGFTGVPGDGRQIFVVGHNNQLLRNAERMANGDLVEFKTTKGTHKYQVYDRKIVDKNDFGVVTGSDAEGEVLVLMTCFPINYYFSDAPQRYLVYAKKI